MKKLITITSSLVLAATMGSAIAAPTTQAQAPVKKANPTFLFAMYAKQASIKKVNNDTYALTIDKANVKDITAFSNRPYRIVDSISPATLANMWKVKTNSFTKDSPNVAIAGTQLNPAVVVMTGMKVEPNTIDYLIESKSPINNGTYNNVSLFVDGAKYYGCQFGPIHSWCPE